MTAFFLTCGGLASAPCPPDFGADEIGRAAAICYSHVERGMTSISPPPPIPQFRKGWEACTKVYAAWLDGEVARKQREREAEEERQRQFIIDFAGRLKRPINIAREFQDYGISQLRDAVQQ